MQGILVRAVRDSDVEDPWRVPTAPRQQFDEYTHEVLSCRKYLGGLRLAYVIDPWLGRCCFGPPDKGRISTRLRGAANANLGKARTGWDDRLIGGRHTRPFGLWVLVQLNGRVR